MATRRPCFLVKAMPLMSRRRIEFAGFVALLLVVSAGAVGSGALSWRDDLSEADRARVAGVTAPTADFTKPEAFERLSAGAGTSQATPNRDAFSHPAANLDFEGKANFNLGNGLFRKTWVPSPSSTLASDGLGPLFNARSCQECH